MADANSGKKAKIKHQGCEVEVTTPNTLDKPEKVK
jgi:hypothetical protein